MCMGLLYKVCDVGCVLGMWYLLSSGGFPTSNRFSGRLTRKPGSNSDCTHRNEYDTLVY